MVVPARLKKTDVRDIGGLRVRRSVQKAGFQLGGGHGATVLAAKPAVAVAGHEAVNGIADGGGNGDKRIQKRPTAVHLPRHAQGSRGFGVKPFAFNQYERIEMLRGKPEMPEPLLPGGRLQRGEHEFLLRVAFNHKLHGPVAEVAHAIEEQQAGDCRVGGIFRHCAGCVGGHGENSMS